VRKNSQEVSPDEAYNGLFVRKSGDNSSGHGKEKENADTRSIVGAFGRANVGNKARGAFLEVRIG